MEKRPRLDSSLLMATAAAATLQLAVLAGVVGIAQSYDVLMVIGGMSVENGMTNTHRAVELVGIDRVCPGPPLPVALQGASAARISEGVLVCGGNDGTYESNQCFAYEARQKRWVRLDQTLPSTPAWSGVVFGSMAGVDGGRSVVFAGGRTYNHTTTEWDYRDQVWRLDLWGSGGLSPAGRWHLLPSLQNATADGCMLSVNRDLIYIGGSVARYRHADDPSKVWVLQQGGTRWRDDLIPPLRGEPRMWHACTLATIDSRVGILVAGGYSSGRLVEFFPLSFAYVASGKFPAERGQGRRRGFDWQEMGWLPGDRKYGPALGLVAGVPTVASGHQYGDSEVDDMVATGHWRRVGPRRRLTFKREFASFATVPHHWFPHCGF